MVICGYLSDAVGVGLYASLRANLVILSKLSGQSQKLDPCVADNSAYDVINLVEQVQGNLSSQTPTQVSTSTPANTPIQANVTSRTQTQGMCGGRAGKGGAL
ncbi:PREDICTED: uncharacterized protein LOC101308093 isoform 1 [Fragaria vesca subsp. vesca]